MRLLSNLMNALPLCFSLQMCLCQKRDHGMLCVLKKIRWKLNKQGIKRSHRPKLLSAADGHLKVMALRSLPLKSSKELTEVLRHASGTSVIVLFAEASSEMASA